MLNIFYGGIKIFYKTVWLSGEVGAIASTNKPLVLKSFGYGYSTEGLFVMAVALTFEFFDKFSIFGLFLYGININ